MSSHTAQTELKLIGKLLLEGDITCQTGLHIGAGKGSLEIGGADNPVVKDAFGLPYIPGSSLRGKLRSMLEQSSGMAVPGELVYLSKRKGQEVRIHQSERPDDEVCLCTLPVDQLPHVLGVDSIAVHLGESGLDPVSVHLTKCLVTGLTFPRTRGEPLSV